MKRKLSLVALAMMLTLSMQASSGLLRTAKARVRAGGGASAQQASGASGSVAVIVELESEPVTMHQRLTERIPRREIDFESPSARAYEAQLDSEHSDFKTRAALVSPNLRVRADLRKLANAVSVEVSPSEVAAIAALPGVKRVELVKEVHTLLDASVPLINAPALWARLGGVGAAGQGMKIAILDTGIDITNPLFSDAGLTLPAGFPKTTIGSEALTNNKVIAAKSFLRPVSDAQDQNGHGSNVAGIAAGSVTGSPLGTISGVAPMAYLGNYRVLGADGSGRTDLIAQGIEQAVADGFDVLSMSFGASDDGTPDITETMTEAAVAAGKIVVIAAGNDGPDPATINTPGTAPSAITVAASTNAHVVGPVIAVAGPGAVPSVLSDIGSTKGSGSTAVFDSTLGPLPYVDADPQGRACQGIQAGSLNGMIALIERGNCDFVTKINAAASAGARAAIIFNRDASEDTAGSSGGGDNLFTMLANGTTIPSFFVIRSKGLALRDFVRANPGATVSIAVFGSGSFTPDVIADFSSRGPSSVEGLKPDVAAPGVIIYSAAARTGSSSGVVDPSGFLAISGTSQATPHVAGAAALIKQLNPSFTPAQVKSALVSSATTDVFTTPDQTARVGVLDTGGGRVDLARASSVSATFSPTSLSFGIRKLKKNDVDVSLDLNIMSVVDGQNTFTVSVQQLDPGDGVNVAPSVSAVTLARGQTTTVTIRNTAVVGSQRRDYTGYVLVSGGGQTLHVPYWVRYVKKKS
ncbi:MAG TPA: S8 family serine peptidase [Blastocatellia bacterium]|nr:S8 family serine peptidase [Blastocatellia bacterium]